MKSGELSIVAGVYLLTLAYMTDRIEWIVAGGLLLIFGVVLMCVDMIPKREEQRMVTMPLPSEPRPRAKFITLPEPSFPRPVRKKPRKVVSPPPPDPGGAIHKFGGESEFNRYPYPGSARHHDPTKGSDEDVK